MTTATDNQFDADKCVRRDGRKCEFDVNNDGDWREAYYIGPDVSVARSVIRSPHIGNSRPASIETRRIRNIQPKPRTEGRYVIERPDGSRFLDIIQRKEDGLKCVGTVTIDLDKCEQVQPDGVMTPDELAQHGIYVSRTDDGRWCIERLAPVENEDWSRRDTWFRGAWDFGSYDQYLNELSARIEASRIIKEGLHNA